MERELRKLLPGGQFVAVGAKRSKAMGAVRGKGNRSTEVRLRFALVGAGIKGWKLHPIGLFGRPDFFFPRENIAVFVDGCFWHGCQKCGHIPKKNSKFWKAKIERNKERDQQTTLDLRSNGIGVIRFWEHELRNNLQECVGSLRGLLDDACTPRS